MSEEIIDGDNLESLQLTKRQFEAVIEARDRLIRENIVLKDFEGLDRIIVSNEIGDVFLDLSIEEFNNLEGPDNK